MVGSRVYVGGLPYGVRERDLQRFFKGYGRTRDILIKNGYGFVEFEDYRDADDAVYELNGKELLGERVVVEPARGTARGPGGRRENERYDRYDRRGSRYDKNRTSSRSSTRYGPPMRTEYRLVVENLSTRVSWQDLKDYMRQAGEVTYADAHKQRKNEGVVEFASSSDMRNAIEKLDDTELNGRRIRLVEDRGGRGGGAAGGAPRNGRGRSRSSSSRSRSRSRRRSPRSRSRSRRSSRSRSKTRSRSKSKNGSKSPEKSRSRSRSRSIKSRERDSKSKSRSRSPKRSPSRSRSKSERRSRSKSVKDNKSRSNSRSRSRSRSHSRGSRGRSHSVDKNDKSRSASPKNNDHSPDRNESMED